MALRRPIVLGTTGRKELLQAGDTLDIGYSPLGIDFTNTSGSSIPAGTPVYVVGTTVHLSDQGGGDSTSWVQGLVTATVAGNASGRIQFSGLLTLTTAEWDAVAGTTGGLTPNAKLWFHTTVAGKLTGTLPNISSTINKYLISIGRAQSATTLEIRISARVLL